MLMSGFANHVQNCCICTFFSEYVQRTSHDSCSLPIIYTALFLHTFCMQAKVAASAFPWMFQPFKSEPLVFLNTHEVIITIWGNNVSYKEY